MHVVPQRLAALLAAIARFAMAAEGDLHPAVKPIVDEDLADSHALGGAVRGVDICGVDTAHQPILVLLAMLMVSSSDPVFNTDRTELNT